MICHLEQVAGIDLNVARVTGSGAAGRNGSTVRDRHGLSGSESNVAAWASVWGCSDGAGKVANWCSVRHCSGQKDLTSGSDRDVPSMAVVGGATVDQTSVLKCQGSAGNIDIAGFATRPGTEIAPESVRIDSAGSCAP